jgi:hypothetical protein
MAMNLMDVKMQPFDQMRERVITIGGNFQGSIVFNRQGAERGL